MNQICLNWRATVGALATAVSCGLGAAAAAPPVVHPEDPPLESSRPLSSDGKTRLAVSGIACAHGGASRPCLVAFDEGVKAQFAMLGAGHLEPVGPPIALVATGGELDAEGAATDGQYFYVVGSHSVKRNSCKSNSASRHVVRFKATWPTPAASAPEGAQAGVEAGNMDVSDRLWSLMQRDAYLSQHIDGCLGSGKGGRPEQMRRRPGLNIEGIAVQAGRLYFGFRGPSEAGMAPVFSVDGVALFDGSDARPRLERLQVGSRIGIRDMVAGASALLLLLGPDDHDAPATARWQVAQWTPSVSPGPTGRPRVLATLNLGAVHAGDCAAAGARAIKPEALSILEETTTAYRVVVLSDGACDGGALIFNLPK